MKSDESFSPRSFMEQRRPGSFSDTQVIKEPQLDSLKLEYHLDTLSTRKQEYNFEEFARKLCEHEIQPNLRPQTGPVGGGDGKVDTETTPVSEVIKDTYYFGVEKASTERWGFAFSTTVRWKTKVEGDVKKMVGTDRGYTKVFFVTSRFIKADQRAKVEDDLTKQYGIPVTIHDRTWIIDKVFSNKRENLAIDELKIGDSYKEVVSTGPKDTKRQRTFEALNKNIDQAVQKDRVNLAIVDDALSSALCGAEMNKVKTDVEGLFTRAKRLAQKYGTPEQYFNAIYHEIWTLYFWYNDFDALISKYEEIESLAKDSTNLFEVERLSNLVSVLKTLSVIGDKVDPVYADEKKKAVQGRLEAFKDDESKPSAAIHAELLLNILVLPKSRDDKAAMDVIFDNLFQIVERSKGLLGFSLDTLYKMTSEMNDFYSGVPSFEKLQDKMLEVMSERKSSTESAMVLLNRAAQHIEGKRYYKAINCLGKSLVPLYKEEVRDGLIVALAQLSCAYEEVGLLWAARSAMLHAASYATMDFHKHSEVTKLQLLSYRHLRLLELRLGRVGYSLEWHKLNHMMNVNYIKSSEEVEKLLHDDMFYGAQLGLLLIKTPDEVLSSLELLPNALMSMDLDLAAHALIYRLGGKKALPQVLLEKMNDEELDEYFDSHFTQPSQAQLPDVPAFYLGDEVELKSVILGTTFIVKTKNCSPNIEIGEYILASLEGFLATTVEMDSHGNKGVVNITITKDDTLGVKVSHEVKKDGAIAFDIACGDFNLHSLKRSEQESLYKDVFSAVVSIIGHSISFRDANTDLEKLFRDEEVSARAFTFSSPLVVQGNVLGYKPKRDIKEWITDGNKRYEYNEAEAGKVKYELLKQLRDNPDKQDEKDYKDRKAVRHDQMKNISIIEEHLWDEAGWEGIAYLVMPNQPPVLAVMFTNEGKAKAIFKNWKDLFGREDKKDVMRVATIMGFSKANPLWYKFVISTNFGDPKDSKGKLMVNAGRTHTMTPQSLNNLNGFIESFKQWGFYLIAPSFIEDKQSFPPKIFFDYGIVKENFINKNAWEIGPMDPEVIGLRYEDTEPVIPKGVINPPILETIELRMNPRNKSR